MIVRPRQTGQMNAGNAGTRVRDEGDRLLSVARRDLDAVVASCPGWRTRDLVAHVAQGWQYFGLIVSEASTSPPSFEGLAALPDDDDRLLEAAADALTTIGTALDAADPSTPVWTWTDADTMAFYARRVLNETVVHRVDAEAALGDRSPLDPDLAIDGVDELFTVLAPMTSAPRPAGSLHLHRTDGEGEFLLVVDDGEIRVTREHAKGDAALRAGGEDLLLVMYRRRDLEGLEIFGDRSVVEDWAGLAP